MNRCEHCQKEYDPSAEEAFTDYCSQTCMDGWHKAIYQERARKWWSSLPVDYRKTEAKRIPNQAKLNALMAHMQPDNYAYASNIWAFGETGVGKTRAMLLLGRELITECYHDIEDIIILWGTEFQREVHRRTSSRDGDFDGYLESLQDQALIFFDDVHKMTFPDRTAAEFHTLIEYRKAHRLPTFFTSKKSPVEMVAHIGDDYGEEVMRRITEDCLFVNFNKAAAGNVIPMISA